MLGVCAALLFLLPTAHAGMVDASLISSAETVVPGSSFDAGLRLVMREGWHTYWLNPGDSGLATHLSWRLPPGWEAGELEWPAPRRLVLPPLTSFGYDAEVVLPVRLTAPRAGPNARSTLRATADWLECREVCIPGRAELALTVGLGPARPDRRGTALLAAARAQVPRPGSALGARLEDRRVVLELAGRHPRAEFFPRDKSLFESGRPPAALSPTRTELSVPRAPGSAEPRELAGVLLRPGLPPAEMTVAVRTAGALPRHLLLAFLGGLLLNLMPCVFPVLSIKVLGLLGRAASPAAGRAAALAYTAGVVLCFEALAGGLLAARAAGATLGWGFQLQSPPVVAALALLFLALGLNLLGVFTVGERLMGLGAGLSSRQGWGGAFFSGVFAVVVAAPCTAPFMGAALAWALGQPTGPALTLFAVLGLGTAAPYAVLAWWPGGLKRLPRPGPWMETLRKALSLPMFATAVWLAVVLGQLLLPAAAEDEIWKPWSRAAVAQARASGRTVFVDFTAAWCLSCQVNERLVLSRPQVRAALKGAAAFRADWTGREPAIAAELAQLGRSGVPLYVVYPKAGEAVLLPEVLTPGLVLDALSD